LPPHGRIVVLDGHQFGVEVIGFSADQGAHQTASSTAHVQLGMMSVSDCREREVDCHGG
jgi:hypothetical protein